MINYIVVDDSTGDFIAIDRIVAIIDDGNEGSKIVVGTEGTAIRSPLKPRELLRRLTIIKFKRENERRENAVEASVANAKRSTL